MRFRLLRACRLIPIAGVAALLWVMSGCSEGENSLLNPGGNRTGLTTPPDTVVVSAPEADRHFLPQVATGTLPALYLARTDSVEAVIYLRFANLPDTALVDRAHLGLRLGGGGGAALRIEAYEVVGDRDWTESGLRWADRPTLADEPFDARPDAVEPNGDSTLVARIAQIPGDMIRRWRRDPESNGGFALKITADSPPGFLQVLSREAVFDSIDIINPELAFLQGDSVIALRAATADAYVYEVAPAAAAIPGDAPQMVVADWLPARSLLRFQVPDTFPPGSAINRAILRLPLAAALPERARAIGVYRATSAWEESTVPDSVGIGSSYDVVLSPTEIDSSAEAIEFDIGALVQRWLAEEENYGVQIRSLLEGGGAERFLLHAREAEDPARRPSLTVIYTRPPDSRWGDPPPEGSP